MKTFAVASGVVSVALGLGAGLVTYQLAAQPTPEQQSTVVATAAAQPEKPRVIKRTRPCQKPAVRKANKCVITKTRQVTVAVPVTTGAQSANTSAVSSAGDDGGSAPAPAPANPAGSGSRDDDATEHEYTGGREHGDDSRDDDRDEVEHESDHSEDHAEDHAEDHSEDHADEHEDHEDHEEED